MHLITIPFAGGTSFSFRPIQNYLDQSIQVTSVEFPGHGTRFREPLINDLHSLVEDIYAQLPINGTPFALWGHSMGGIAAYLLAHLIRFHNRPLPIHLFISGSSAPSIPRREKSVYCLPRDAFIEKLNTYGGVPKEVLEETELMDLFLPVLRADFQALETYQYINTTPLPIPITAMYGNQEEINEKDVLAWQQESSLPLILKRYEGKHFFIFENAASIANDISNTLHQ